MRNAKYLKFEQNTARKGEEKKNTARHGLNVLKAEINEELH